MKIFITCFCNKSVVLYKHFRCFLHQQILTNLSDSSSLGKREIKTILAIILSNKYSIDTFNKKQTLILVTR